MTLKEYPMITPEEALATVLAHARPLSPVQRPLAEAIGATLAVEITAEKHYPPQPTATVDGFAIIADDPSSTRIIVGEQLAGHYNPDLQIGPGQAVRITTGAHLPTGADAVVMWEDVLEENGAITLQKTIAAGTNFRPVGVDMAAGQTILAAGTHLGPPEIGLLASLGNTKATIYPSPRVAVLSSGDEVRETGMPLAPGQLWDSNRYALRAAILQTASQPLDMGIVPDDENILAERLQKALGQASVLVTSGGASRGQRDLLKLWLEENGQVLFGRVFQKPGKPMTFATVGGKAVFTLPGNPVSALVSFTLYVRPFLLKLQGRSETLTRLQVKLTTAEKHAPDRIEFVRARVWHEDNQFLATSTGYQGSARLLSLVGANALLRLPPSDEPVPAGTIVEALLLPGKSLFSSR